MQGSPEFGVGPYRCGLLPVAMSARRHRYHSVMIPYLRPQQSPTALEPSHLPQHPLPSNSRVAHGSLPQWLHAPEERHPCRVHLVVLGVESRSKESSILVNAKALKSMSALFLRAMVSTSIPVDPPSSCFRPTTAGYCSSLATDHHPRCSPSAGFWQSKQLRPLQDIGPPLISTTFNYPHLHTPRFTHPTNRHHARNRNARPRGTRRKCHQALQVRHWYATHASTSPSPQLLPCFSETITSPQDHVLIIYGFIAGYDARFPNQNQTKHCWQNYVDYHKCILAKGEEFKPCRQV
jgi:hypothetical protein